MKHFGHLIRILGRSIAHSVTGAMAQMDLTSAQGRIMGYLARRDSPPCARDIEEEFNLSHATVSGLLSRLERKGFIEFLPDARDKRCKRIHILPKGTDCNERIYRTIQENERLIVRGFSRQEREQFADLLTRAAENLRCETPLHFDKEDPEK